MALKVPVAHDFTCGWCWIGLHQIQRLRCQFDIEIDWLPYELYPASEGFPLPSEAKVHDSRRPATPGRFAFALAAEGMEPPRSDLPELITRFAHQAVEFSRRFGKQDEMVARIYRAYWVHGLPIDQIQTLSLLGAGLVPDVSEMIRAIEAGECAEKIVPYSDPAHETGVFNLPTFWIGGQRYAEQPIGVLRSALQRELGEPDPAQVSFYGDLKLPATPENRPYLMVNMVTTLDGKTTPGERDSHVMDLGSTTDHTVMRMIEGAVDAVMIGAGTLRATPKLWYPKRLARCVVTRSGNLDFESRFFTDAPDKVVVIGPEGTQTKVPEALETIEAGKGEANLLEALRRLKLEHSVSTLLVEGGSDLNAELLRLDVVDELFLTLAPKVKLGAGLPTYAGGRPLPGREMHDFSLIEHHRVGDELFLRYRRKR